LNKINQCNIEFRCYAQIEKETCGYYEANGEDGCTFLQDGLCRNYSAIIDIVYKKLWKIQKLSVRQTLSKDSGSRVHS